MKVKDCMCKEVVFVKPDCDTEECAKLMCENHIGCIPVCDESKKVVGLVTDRDILLRTVGCGKEIKNTPVSDIMTCNVCCCKPEEDITKAEKLMSQNQIRRLPVCDENKNVIGFLSIGDLAQNDQLLGKQNVCETISDICRVGT